MNLPRVNKLAETKPKVTADSHDKVESSDQNGVSQASHQGAGSDLPSAPAQTAGGKRLKSLTPSRATRESSQRKGKSRREVKSRRSTLPAIEASHAESSLAHELVHGAKSLGVSFVVHVLLIVILALVTYRIASKQMVQVEIAPVDTILTEEMETEIALQVGDVTDSSVLENTTSFNESPEFQLHEYSAAPAAETEYVSDDFAELLANSGLSANLAKQGKNGEGGPKASFYGIEATGRRFVFVVDRSGSMTGEPWLEARAELVRSIKALSDEQEFFVVLFNHESSPMLGMRGRREKLLEATNENVNKVIKWIETQAPDGNTSPKASIKQALRLKPDVIFLLSDGVFRDGTLEYLRKHNSQVPLSYGQKMIVVHTIAFKDPVGRWLLEQIARENGGVFKFVD